MTTKDNPEKGPRNPAPRKLDCEAWEAMLADALDGALEPRDAEAFAAHSKTCAAGCGELLEEAQRGAEWLRFLRQTPPAPEGLLEKILAGTTGLPDAQQPLAIAGVAALPRQPWLGVPIGILQRHVAESRILMTLAMAFFSIALTLNLTGVHLNQLKFADLKPATLASSVSRQYFSTTGHLTHYYENLRIVYLLESRLDKVRQDNEQPANQQPTAQPQNSRPQNAQPQSQPASQPSGKPGGSARRGGGVARPAPGQSPYESPAPVLASCPKAHSDLRPLLETLAHGPHQYLMPYPGESHKPTERSLV